MIQPTYFKWPGKVWVTSDPHFGDVGILKYERTQFKDIDEHDEFILNVINKTLNSGDTLVILGDIGHQGIEKCNLIRNDVYKVLIKGNHDVKANKLYNETFNEVYSGPIFANKFVVLSHEPIPVSEHFLNLHGHLHNSILDDPIHYINLSIHMHDYKLFQLDEAYEKCMAFPRIKAKFLKEWYKDKYVFTNLDRLDVWFYKDNGHIVPSERVEYITEWFLRDHPESVTFINSRNCLDVGILSTDDDYEFYNKLLDRFNQYLEKGEK